MSSINTSGAVSLARADATFNNAVNQGTYNLGTVSGGRAMITAWAAKQTVTATGLTSLQLKSSDGLIWSPAVPLANLGAGGHLSQSLANPILLESGDSVQMVVLGNGTGGSTDICFLFVPMSDSAVIT